MNSKYDQIILSHYDNVANKEKDEATSTMANLFVRNAETTFIINMISEFMSQQKKNEVSKVLDVGCGNGYTIGKLRNIFPELDFSGLEFNDSLREIAKETLSTSSIKVVEGDIRNKKTLEKFEVDILICQRVIINLLNVDDQKNALNNLLNIVNKGGLLIFIECFESGLDSLNKARQEFKLEAMSPAHHNLYLSDDFFDVSDLKEFDFSQKEFLSNHYFVSRALHQSFLEASQQDFIRNSEFVTFFSQALPNSVGTYSPIKFLAFTKTTNND